MRPHKQHEDFLTASVPNLLPCDRKVLQAPTRQHSPGMKGVAYHHFRGLRKIMMPSSTHDMVYNGRVLRTALFGQSIDLIQP